jgi:hypothetical protein
MADVSCFQIKEHIYFMGTFSHTFPKDTSQFLFWIKVFTILYGPWSPTNGVAAESMYNDLHRCVIVKIRILESRKVIHKELLGWVRVTPVGTSNKNGY